MDAGDAASADAGAAAQGPPDASSQVTKKPRFEPTEPLGCEPVAASVKYRSWRIQKSCPTLARTEVPSEPVGAGVDIGILVADSAEAFQGALGCKPPSGADFSTQRLVTYAFVHDSNRVYSLAGVVRRGGELHIVFDIHGVCQGIPPTARRSVRVIGVPRGSAPVRVAFCNHPTQCRPVP